MNKCVSPFFSPYFLIIREKSRYSQCMRSIKTFFRALKCLFSR